MSNYDKLLIKISLIDTALKFVSGPLIPHYVTYCTCVDNVSFLGRDGIKNLKQL